MINIINMHDATMKIILCEYTRITPIPVARRPRLVSAAPGLLGLRVRISPGVWKSVPCECCVLSGTDLCVELTRLEESYRMWWV